MLAFHPLLHLTTVLNHGYSFCFKLMIPNSYDYPLPTLDQMMNNLNGTMLYNCIINSCKSAYFSNGSCTNDSVESCNTNRSSPLRCSVLYQWSASFVPITSQPSPFKLILTMQTMLNWFLSQKWSILLFCPKSIL